MIFLCTLIYILPVVCMCSGGGRPTNHLSAFILILPCILMCLYLHLLTHVLILIHAHGNTFAGVHVFGPEGAHLGAVLTGAKTANLALGDDGYLYMATDSQVKRIKWTRPPKA